LPVSDRSAWALTAVITDAHKVRLGPVEMARGLGLLVDELGSQAEVARMTGMRPATISRHLRLLDADEATLEAVRSGKLKVGSVHGAISERRGRRPGRRPGRRRAPRHFTATWALAPAAAERCSGAGHEPWTRLNGVACGACIEETIRQDQDERR